MFLLSPDEINLPLPSYFNNFYTKNQGTSYDFYKYTLSRIVYSDNIAVNWRLRSSYTGDANGVYYIDTEGNYGNYGVTFFEKKGR